MTDSDFGLMSEEQLATLRCMTVGSLRNERSEGRGPAYVKVNGKTVKYPIDAVRKYLAANTIDPAKTHPTLAEGRPVRRRSSAA